MITHLNVLTFRYLSLFSKHVAVFILLTFDILTYFSIRLAKWVACVDIAANDQADANVVVNMTESFTEQASQVVVTFITCEV